MKKKFKDILKYQKNHSNSDKVSLKINTNVNIEVVKKTVLNFVEKVELNLRLTISKIQF